ncbi:MAG: peptidoglycan editing factor PgeF [Anaerolineaceae bacterium]
MHIVNKDGLEYYTFDSFPSTDLIHGVFTRKGGVSPAPFVSLNLGGSIGDSQENVIENRKRIFNVFNKDVESIFDVWQVHGNTVIYADQPRPLDSLHEKADAIITDSPKVTLFMRFADCVPIFLYDPQNKAVGLVHAGWKGTVNKIVQDSVVAMKNRFGTEPKHLLAAIGPSIGPDHYQIGRDVIKQVKRTFDQNDSVLFKGKDGKIFLDLWEANRVLLLACGVQDIEVAKICTACDTQGWYSHRKENGLTGRFGAIIALK